MEKKADMSVNTIVAAALALIILIILIFIFKGQIGNLSNGFFQIGNDAKAGASGTKCVAMLTQRVCGTTAPNGYTTVQPAIPKPCKTYVLDSAKKPTDVCKEIGWSDCNSDCYDITKNPT